MLMLSLIGKTNCGKTTFFNAATLQSAEISNRIFTTIKPNVGMAFVRTQCPCKRLNIKCNPKTLCIDGTRFVPVNLTDVAGLVPGAHLGKGLGNQFLSDAMVAKALIHVIDISGSTDIDGKPCQPMGHDPIEDINFLEEEIDQWLSGIVEKSKSRKPEAILKQLSGLGIHSIDPNMDISSIRKKAKPMIIAANKIDVSDGMLDNVKKKYDVMPCSADAELALKRAAEKNIIKYTAGSSDFEIMSGATNNQINALENIRLILKKYGSTGVQQILEKAVFELLNMIVVYPVQNEKFSDNKGRVLPDAFLLQDGSTPRDLAFQVHEDIGKNFIAAVDAKTGMSIKADSKLKNGDIVTIKHK